MGWCQRVVRQDARTPQGLGRGIAARLDPVVEGGAGRAGERELVRDVGRGGKCGMQSVLPASDIEVVQAGEIRECISHRQ